LEVTVNPTSAWTDTIGLDPASLVDQLVTKGLSKYDASRLVNNLVAVNLGQSPRHFTFSAPLPATDSPTCAPTFARSFEHQDWVDGESVVQAGESADDKGFNWRFNALAADLDALHADTARMFQCLSTLRQALVQALQDVAAELNRLDSDVAGLTTKVPPHTPWNVNVADAPQFLGVRELDGNKVTMWKTGGNVMVLPGVDTVALQDTVSQRLGTGGLVSRYAVANEQFAHDVGAGMPVKELIAKYGTDPLGDGRTVAQGLAVLPPDATYPNPQAVVDAVNGQEQAFLRSTVGSVDAVGAVLGVTSAGVPLAEVSPAGIAKNIAGTPAELGSALTRAGLVTVNDVAGISADQLVARLGEQGVQITPAQAGELASRASMIAGFGG
jgi:hypothetical protein